MLFSKYTWSRMKKTKIRYNIIMAARTVTSYKLKNMKLESSLGLIFTAKINLQDFSFVFWVSIRFPKITICSFFWGGFWALEPVKVPFLCGLVHFWLNVLACIIKVRGNWNCQNNIYKDYKFTLQKKSISNLVSHFE